MQRNFKTACKNLIHKNSDCSYQWQSDTTGPEDLKKNKKQK